MGSKFYTNFQGDILYVPISIGRLRVERPMHYGSDLRKSKNLASLGGKHHLFNPIHGFCIKLVDYSIITLDRERDRDI